MRRYPHNARPRLARKPDNRAQGDQPGGRNRPSGKDRTPLLLRSLPSQDDGPAPATRWRRPSPLELPAARRSSSSAAQFGGIRLQGQRCRSSSLAPARPKGYGAAPPMKKSADPLLRSRRDAPPKKKDLSARRARSRQAWLRRNRGARTSNDGAEYRPLSMDAPK